MNMRMKEKERFGTILSRLSVSLSQTSLDFFPTILSQNYQIASASLETSIVVATRFKILTVILCNVRGSVAGFVF